ncbi:2-polyprenyl-6-methoxyphenol hydroxylase [Rhizobium leguminosarum]|uniref:FAD-dependent monooxygenase n=1 Tax=Rhizobium leguminosarum TaxID=384 RepID=UPI001C9449FB|nr:FAD-dependent monooxygenase [Rhizobium leguminosarum]MBY5775159.1 2-polyprenyl-6-methoxyphenol hydroxylase [Rhizobium leguminosarum]
MNTQVLIVGAGPVGLTLAIDLGKQGVRCILIEKKESPEFLPKMERCNARTMEIYRRLGIAGEIRSAGLRGDVPMDVFVTTTMTEPPLLHLEYDSVDIAQAKIAGCEDTSQPAEAYQLVSQYTLEPVLKAIAETLPSVTVMYGTEFEAFEQDAAGVTTSARHLDGTVLVIRSDYLAGCDGGGSRVRKALGISLRGEGNLLKLRQALYRCDELFDRLPLGKGPGQGRHYHVADNQASFLIMQDSTRHWTLHSVVEDDAAMAKQFEKVVGTPVKYEMLYVGEWKQNLLLADRYSEGRVFLAGDSAHLVIPTGGLGMNTGVGDAVDLSWKLAAVLNGWGGPKLLEAYELERRPIGDRNIGASRYASLGRRRWRSQWAPGFNDETPQGESLRRNLARVADTEQRKTNEMIGAELGYRYIDSPLIWDEPGGPEQLFRTYDPTAWTGVRLPHIWVQDGVSIHDLIGRTYAVLRMGRDPESVDPIVEAFRSRGAPITVLDFPEDRYRELYKRAYFLVRPDLHIAWRSNELPEDPARLAAVATGQAVEGLSRLHAANRHRKEPVYA